MHPSLIRSDAALLEVIERCHGQTELFLDCEFQTEGRYYPKLCLLQMAFGSEIWAVEPRRVNLAAFAPLLQAQGITKVFHDGRQDLPILARAIGIDSIGPVFDTQIGAAFVGYGGSVGYAALVQSLCGVKLDKSLQVSDWSRDLSDPQIDYALDDVRYLATVSAALRVQLDDKRRRAWAMQACEQGAIRALSRPDPDKLYRRVSSTSRLNPQQLGILREIAKWRHHVAETLDKPAPNIANDLALKAMALHPPRELAALDAVRGLGVGRNQPWANQLLEAVVRGTQRPEPNQRNPLSTEQEARVDGIASLLGIARRFVATRDGIAAELLSDQTELRAIAEWHLFGQKSQPDFEVLNSWRREVLGELLLDVLSGNVTFRVNVAEASGVALVRT